MFLLKLIHGGCDIQLHLDIALHSANRMSIYQFNSFWGEKRDGARAWIMEKPRWGALSNSILFMQDNVGAFWFFLVRLTFEPLLEFNILN